MARPLYIILVGGGTREPAMPCLFHQSAAHFDNISNEARQIQIQCIIDDDLRK